MRGRTIGWLVCGMLALPARWAMADSVNSPNITLNVDTNRSATTAAGAGDVAIVVNTITLAEISLPEYSAGSGQAISFQVRPGYQLDPTSNITAQSATIGFNGGTVNAVASVTPTGAADEVITFVLTAGTNANVQDIIRVNGVRIRILNAAGAAGPAQTTMAITTSTAGGAFTDQGIVAANITPGAPQRLTFGSQPGSNAAGIDLLPAVSIIDFGGNTVTAPPRNITLAIQDNPGAATLLGTASLPTVNGVAAWSAAEHLRINTAAPGYTLRATHDGPPLLTSDTVDSDPFDIVAGAPGFLQFTTQPVNTAAGEALVVAVTAFDELGNPAATPVGVTMGIGENPTDTALRVTSDLSKDTVSGVASFEVADGLRINEAGTGYRLVASGVGAPVESDAFDVVAATPNRTRYAQQPTDVEAGAVVDPTVQVEIVDEFGNRTASTAEIEITLLESACGGSLVGGVENAVDGVATFDDLALNTPCDSNTLKAAAPELGWEESEPFAVTGESLPVALKSATMKPGQLALIGRGPVTLPAADDNPTIGGGALVVTGATGQVVHSLPAEAWAGLGPNGDGSKGFRFRGSVCTVIVKASGVKASCSKTGTLAVPEAGPLQAVLRIGSGTRYCASCGGTAKGNAAKVFKRKACAAPAACP